MNAPAAPADVVASFPSDGPSIRTGGIRRLHWKDCDRREYRRRHLNGLEPAIVTGAIDHGAALTKWTPGFFGEHYGTRTVSIDGAVWRLDDLIAIHVGHTSDHPHARGAGTGPSLDAPPVKAAVVPCCRSARLPVRPRRPA